MPQSHADHNLLFGILALQMDFIGREALIKAMHAWVLAKHKTLGQILVEHHALSPERHTLLDALVGEHLKQHNDDPQRSLASVSSLGSVRRELEQVADPDLQASLGHIPSTQPPTDPQATVDHSAGTPTSSGLRFRVLRPHARGGLGEVFVAHDEELHREVALKQIQIPHADDPHSRARFLLEAEITGGLEHPGIVPVYGLGTYADGRPFYAMRFIKGNTFQDAINQFHLADVPSRDPGERALALRQLLGRFVDVCNAVSYAHARGVLHRDLKPGNAILGRYGETLVVDWGLAKPLGRPTSGEGEGTEGPLQPALASGSAPTQMGSAIGTIPFMSPEQAAGRLDELGPASDVYSLGATLYCLLTGKAAFEGKDRGLLLQRVQQGEFPRPRQVKREAPAALEAICLKAMALRPQDRYGSAQALADDVEHWLADEPVTAYREPWPARLGRWARRHRPLVASAAAHLLTAVAALVVGIVAVNREKKRTEDALAAESRARQRTREALDEMSSQVIEDWLSRRGPMEPAQRDFLEKALAYSEDFAEESGNSAESRQSVAGAHWRIGNIRYRLGQNNEAEAAYRRSQQLFASLAADFPTAPEYRLGLAQSHTSLGQVQRATGHLKEAEASWREALDISKQLAEAFPALPQYRQELANTYHDLGLLLMQLDRLEEAETAFRASLDLRNALAADFPAVPQHRQAYARSHLNLASLLRARHRPKEAEDSWHAALAIQKPVAAEFPTLPQYRMELAATCTNLGVLLSEAGRIKDAESAYRDAVAIYNPLVADFPAVPVYRQNLGQCLHNMGYTQLQTDRVKEAEVSLREAVDIFRRLAEGFPAVPAYQNGLANSLDALAEVARARKDFAAARQLLDQAQSHLQAVLKVNPRNPVYRQYFWENRQLAAATLLDLGEHAAAAEAATDLARFAFQPADDAYKAAGFFARCIPLADKDSKRPEARRKELARSYGDRAVEALRQALSKGYKDIAHLQKDKDLDPLRPRDDFQKLLAEPEKASANRPEK
jgi:serine/threonine-protein kinase